MLDNVRVFIIDDDAAMRDSLEFLLDTAGFAVKSFDSATEFLKTLPNLGFGCVASDIRMPDVDGIQLLMLLKAGQSRLPVVMTTGHGGVQLAVEAMKLGAIDFLEKPSRPNVNSPASPSIMIGRPNAYSAHAHRYASLRIDDDWVAIAL